MAAKKIKMFTAPPVFIRSQPNYMINKVVMKEYRVIIALVIYQKLTFYGTLTFLLTQDQDHIGLEISKRYSTYNLYPS